MCSPLLYRVALIEELGPFIFAPGSLDSFMRLAILCYH